MLYSEGTQEQWGILHGSESGQREGWHPEKQAAVEAGKGEGGRK